MSSGEEPGSRPAASGLGAPVARISMDSVSEAIGAVLDRLATECPDGFENHLPRVAVLSHELPEYLRTILVNLRLLNKPNAGVVLSGLPVDFTKLGPTPLTHDTVEYTDEVRRASGLLYLIASLLGDPMSQAGVRGGRMILDICPLPGDEKTQLASSSEGGLDYHCEDAYHDYRPDWVLLLCLRNPDGVPTTFARASDLPLAEDIKKTLFEKKFIISPDSSHSNKDDIRRVAVFSGDPTSPFVRIDPAFMPRDLNDEAAEKALMTVIDAFDGGLQDVALEPGDIMIIDNLRAVHGRRPFVPRYDGTDRWLRTLTVASDLRRSEGRRSGPYGRALEPQSVFE